MASSEIENNGGGSDLKTVTNTAEFKSCFDPHGIQIHPFQTKPGLQIIDASFIRKFSHTVVLGKGTTIACLCNVMDLSNVTLSESCSLTGLISITSLDGLMLVPNVKLFNLESLTEIGQDVPEGVFMTGLGSLGPLKHNVADTATLLDYNPL